MSRGGFLAVLVSLAVPALASCAASPVSPDGARPVEVDRPRAPRPVTWHEDRVEAAMAEARERGALLVVDAWAPWCHTCLSMKREVLESPALAAYADRIVFAAIDTDKASSAAFVGRYAVEVWPTLFVIDPARDRVLAVHGGAASLDELRRVLDGALALRNSGGGGAFETALAEGASAYAARRFTDAGAAYVRAGRIAHPRASEAHLGAIRATFEAEDYATCASIAAEHLDAVTGAAMAADFTFYARECAKNLPASPDRTTLETRTLAKLRALTSDPPPSASIDDRADALSMLAEAERASGDAFAAKAATDRRVAMLDAAAASARTPKDAAVYDYMRMRAYEDAGVPERAVAMLEERTRQTPNDYEPFARLASVLAKTDPERALVPLLRAVELSYGPRRVRYLEQEADLHRKLGGLSLEVAARRRVVHALEALPEGQRDAEKVEKAKAALDEAMRREMELPGGFPRPPRGARPANE